MHNAVLVDVRVRGRGVIAMAPMLTIGCGGHAVHQHLSAKSRGCELEAGIQNSDPPVMAALFDGDGQALEFHGDSMGEQYGARLQPQVKAGILAFDILTMRTLKELMNRRI